MVGNLKEKTMEIVFMLTACASIVAVVLICIFLFRNGLPAIKEIGFNDFLFGDIWRPGNQMFGIFSMIVGSLYVTAGAIIIGAAEPAIRAVPKMYYEGALALGADHERSTFAVVFPAAKSGVLASVILGIGRAVGETMAVVMIAGNQPRIPQSILKGVRTMTANIVLEMGYATDLHRESLIATGVVLFVFILLINLLFSVLKRKGKY